MELPKELLRLVPQDTLRDRSPSAYKRAYDVEGWRLLFREEPGKGWKKPSTFRERHDARFPFPVHRLHEPIRKPEVLTPLSEHGIGVNLPSLEIACEEIPADRGGFGHRIWTSRL